MNSRMSVSWSSYQKNICNGFGSLQQRGEFVDMTLAADGHYVQVHKMVMCLVSPYIKDLVTATQCAHPVIFLNNVSSETLQFILQYVYSGEALVPTCNIKEFLQACKSLHIKGLENTSTVQLHRESEESMHLINHKDEQDMIEETDDGGVFDDSNREMTLVDSSMTDAEQMDKVNDTPDTIQKIIKNIKTSKQDTNVQYTISNLGHLQVILNRYMYGFNYKRIKTGSFVWRCISNKRGCHAVLVTKDGKVEHRANAHNHPFADKTILKRIQKGIVYSELSQAQERLKDKSVKETFSD